MTIDERIEALTGRHEALTQSVELLTLDIRELRENATQHQLQQKTRDARVDFLHGEMMLAITRLAITTEAHNGQIADLQDRLQRLDK